MDHHQQIATGTALTERDRRIVALTCAAGVGPMAAMEQPAYDLITSGDLTIDQINEITLHFAVYCGWPKASELEATIRIQWHRVHAERGETAPPFPTLPFDDLGVRDHEERIARGREEFVSVNVSPAPPTDSPYFMSGILGFVFGHVWQRPALSRRDRRLVTLPCVGVSAAQMPIQSHVGSALETGDITWDEMQDLIAQFSTYCGAAKAQEMREAAEQWRTSRG